MSLTLDPTLSDAQDNLVRNPIVELVSTQPVPAIPFDGEYFNASDTPEGHSKLLSHSTGSMISAYMRDSEDLIFMYTDINRLMWTEVIIDLELGDHRSIKDFSICELLNGDIGVILIENYFDTTYSLQYAILNSMGGVVVSRVNIIEYNSPNIIDSPFVYRLKDASFLLVYSHFDGTNYSIYKRTSTNFISWSASSSITLSGFELTYSTDHPSLIQVASDDVLLFLDHVSDKLNDNIVTNIYRLESSDSGVTWGAPTQMTSYTIFGTGGLHPCPTITDGNIIKLSFHETNELLALNYDSALWENDCVDLDYSVGASIHYDPLTNKLYVKQLRWGAGTKKLCGVVVIDTENMDVDRNYNIGTIPDYSDLFFDTHVWYGAKKHRSEGKYVAVSTMDNNNMATMVINNDTEIITTYVFKENGSYGDLNVNVNGWDGRTSIWENGSKIFGTWVDADNEKLYIGMAYGYLYQPYILVGYIDLTEEEDPVDGYTFNEISWITSWTEVEVYGLFQSSGGILVINELNQFCLYGIVPVDSWTGRFGVYDISSGNMVSEYIQDEVAGFPLQGIGHCTYLNNHVYGRIEYNTGEGQGIYRGLCDININDGMITYHRPTYQAVNTYSLLDAVVMDSVNIAFADYEYGIAVFNTSDESWTLHDNENISGFDTYGLVSIDYNSIEDIFYVGSVNAPLRSDWAGIRAIPATGSFNQGKYTVGTFGGAAWSFGSSLDLSQGLSDFDFVLAIDNGGVLWSLWVRKDTSYYSIKWDKEQADLDLGSYLIGAVSVSWDIVNIGSLSFRLSHGYLFDDNNTLSTLYIFSKKGRAITLRFGELINGTEYWQNQGTFYIKTKRLSYSRGIYPTISISCEDRVSLLENVEVTVSEYYNEQYPEDIIRDIVPEYTNLELADISIDNFDTRHALWHQVIDENLIESVKEIIDHFGYFLRMDVDNKLITRKVKGEVDAVDHSYSKAAGTIINFTPDDNFSRHANRVVVKGELRDPLEVLYPEELVGSIAGSGGWWSSGNTVETVYFSDDEKKKCRNVRLEIIVSIKDFKILWQESKGTEYISHYDPDELYVEITIEFPRLQGVLIGMLASVIAVGVMAFYCTDDCGMYIMIFTILVSAVGYLLGQVANYEYELYARPVGEVKQSVQAIADNEELQTYTGLILSEEINDEFCYSVPSCQTVADYELGILMAQRKRISFSKIAHLQDEVGDIIQVYHPYSNLPLNIFVTSLKRNLISGKSGSFIDSIEGWNI